MRISGALPLLAPEPHSLATGRSLVLRAQSKSQPALRLPFQEAVSRVPALSVLRFLYEPPLNSFESISQC